MSMKDLKFELEAKKEVYTNSRTIYGKLVDKTYQLEKREKLLVKQHQGEVMKQEKDLMFT